jgi:hypothetical protein
VRTLVRSAANFKRQRRGTLRIKRSAEVRRAGGQPATQRRAETCPAQLGAVVTALDGLHIHKAPGLLNET